jgi:serine/threonine protein kinase
MVSSHLDLKPENILFDGHKVWLIDWQAAFLNDRYYDLGIAANFLANNDEEARAWLQLYFGHPPDDYQLARFFLMRQVLHMAYATVFLLLASASQPADPSATLPDFEEFHQQMWAGEISLAGHEMRRVYGLIHWRQLLHNLRLPRFEQALQLVADRHSGDISIARLLPPRPDPQ